MNLQHMYFIYLFILDPYMIIIPGVGGGGGGRFHWRSYQMLVKKTREKGI